MDFQKYVHQAALTDRIPDEMRAIEIALYGIAGEAGELVSEAKKCFRNDIPLEAVRDRVSEEVGDLLWYIAMLIRRLRLNPDEIAADNLSKTQQIWAAELPPLPAYDDHPYEVQKLPRQFKIEFVEDSTSDPPRAYMIGHGELGTRADDERRRKGKSIDISGQLGDPLDDNAVHDDGYRYHDIIHLGHTVVLGWSPVFRSLIGAKRKDVADHDRIEDGARAVAIEEGLAAFTYSYMEKLGFSPTSFDWDLFMHVRQAVRGLEVSDQPFIAWKLAYTQAFKIFEQLRTHSGGVVECNLDTREMRLVE